MIINIASYPRSGNAFFLLTSIGMGQGWTIDGTSVSVKVPKPFVPVALKHFKGDLDYSSFWTGLPRGKWKKRQWSDWASSKSEIILCKCHWTPDAEYVDKRHMNICVVRDGRDAICSYARFIVNIEQCAGTEWEWQKRLAMETDNKYVPWAKHVCHWLDSPKTGAVVKYEDMLKDASGSVSSAFKKIGVTVPDQFKEIPISWLRMQNPKYFARGCHGAYRTDMDKDARRIFEEKNGWLLEKLGYEV